MIDLIGVHKAFGPKQVLAGLDLHVERGETFVIIGRNGIGKTVTFKHIMGLMKPDRGRVLVEDEDITHMGEGDLIRVRDKFGMVFQGCALLNWLTVAENVALPLRERTRMSNKEIDKVVAAKLELMGLEVGGHHPPPHCTGGLENRAAHAPARGRDPALDL